MALKKTRPVTEENGDKMQTLMEHQIFKMLLPALGFILIGIVSWLFQTVLDLDEEIQQQKIHIEHLHMAEEKFEEQMDDMEKILTDLRVHVGRITAH